MLTNQISDYVCYNFCKKVIVNQGKNDEDLVSSYSINTQATMQVRRINIIIKDDVLPNSQS